MAEAVFLKQLLSFSIFGLVIPLLIAFQLLRRKVPAKFPKMMSVGLAVLGLLLTILVAPYAESLVFGNSLFSESIRVNGDNPGAIGPIMVSLILITPVYWVAISLLYFFMRRRAARTPGPLADARESA